MKKLLLTSAGFENPKVGSEFLKLINNSPSTTKVLFIPTASRTEEELFYVNKSREELLKVGIKEENIIVYNLDYIISKAELTQINVVYICGGNTFYLLHRIREVSFDSILDKLIQAGVVYVGASAGSLVTGPDINIPDYLASNDICLKAFNGLNYTDKIIIPHYSEEAAEMVERTKASTNHPVITLTDKQALLVIDEKEVIIE